MLKYSKIIVWCMKSSWGYNLTKLWENIIIEHFWNVQSPGDKRLMRILWVFDEQLINVLWPSMTIRWPYPDCLLTVWWRFHDRLMTVWWMFEAVWWLLDDHPMSLITLWCHQMTFCWPSDNCLPFYSVTNCWLFSDQLMTLWWT